MLLQGSISEEHYWLTTGGWFSGSQIVPFSSFSLSPEYSMPSDCVPPFSKTEWLESDRKGELSLLVLLFC